MNRFLPGKSEHQLHQKEGGNRNMRNRGKVVSRAVAGTMTLVTPMGVA